VSVFFDTNVLLYADDAHAARKAGIAQGLLTHALGSADGVLSTQVLQEYYENAVKKFRVPPDRARSRVSEYATMRVIAPDVALVLAAIDLHRLDAISFWDALVVRSAQRAGCDVLYSEDLQHGRHWDGVRVVDPFR